MRLNGSLGDLGDDVAGHVELNSEQRRTGDVAGGGGQALQLTK